MSAKNVIDVIIDGKTYKLCGYESEEYLQKVASYINNKLVELKQNEGFRRQSFDIQSTLAYLNIADDYFKAKQHVERLENELKRRDEELYGVKHELASAQVKLEASEHDAKELQEMIGEYEKEVVRLETKIKELSKDKKV